MPALLACPFPNLLARKTKQCLKRNTTMGISLFVPAMLWNVGSFRTKLGIYGGQKKTLTHKTVSYLGCWPVIFLNEKHFVFLNDRTLGGVQ